MARSQRVTRSIRSFSACLLLPLAAVLMLPSAASSRDAASLGDLRIAGDPDRVPDWFLLPEIPVDTSTWQVIDVTKAPYNADPRDNGNDDYFAIQDAIAAAGPDTVIYLPPGTYNILTKRFNPAGVQLNKSRLVLRGAGRDRSHLKIDYVGGYPSKVNVMPQNGERHQILTSRRGWTAGFDRGSRELTLEHTRELAVGDWISAEADYPPRSGHTANSYAYFARITRIDGNRVTIDRPLRDDMRTSNQRVYKFNPLTFVGIEDLEISMPGVPEHNYNPLMRLHGVAYAWVKDCRIGPGFNNIVSVGHSTRYLLSGNHFNHLNMPRASGGAALMVAQAYDGIIENNWFEETNVGIEFDQYSGSGNAALYNYLSRPSIWGCKAPNKSFGRHVFIHGRWVRNTLVEGNDGVCAFQWDYFWGTNGPFNTFFRNRVRHDPTSRGTGWLGPEGSSANHPQTHVNLMGNFVQRLDGNLGGLDERSEDMWVERNISTQGCRVARPTNEAAPECGIGMHRSVRTRWHDNPIRDAAPASWKSLNVPSSLIYLAGPPDYWCQEACSFEAQSGIGAFGDSTGSMCKLPAQIWAEGGTCTPLTQPPTAPAETIPAPKLKP